MVITTYEINQLGVIGKPVQYSSNKSCVKKS